MHVASYPADGSAAPSRFFFPRAPASGAVAMSRRVDLTPAALCGYQLLPRPSVTLSGPTGYPLSLASLGRRPTKVARLQSTLWVAVAESSDRTMASSASAGTAKLR